VVTGPDYRHAFVSVFGSNTVAILRACQMVCVTRSS
jgi:hypothetical protein